MTKTGEKIEPLRQKPRRLECAVIHKNQTPRMLRHDKPSRKPARPIQKIRLSRGYFHRKFENGEVIADRQRNSTNPAVNFSEDSDVNYGYTG